MCVVCVIKICNKSDGREKEAESDRDKEEKRFNLFQYATTKAVKVSEVVSYSKLVEWSQQYVKQ